MSIKNSKTLVLLCFSIFSAVALFSNCQSEPKKTEITENQIAVSYTAAVNKVETNNQVVSNEKVSVPAGYTKNCAECHGANGEGTKKYPELSGITTREEDKLSDEDIVGIINNPKAFGISGKMQSFKTKLTEDEKNEIVVWIKTLKSN